MDKETFASYDPPPSYEEVAGSSPTSQTENLTGAEEAALKDSWDWVPSPPTAAEAHAPKLVQPVVIPRIDVGSPLDVPLPFMRAYSPVLAPHGIPEADFMTFIDNLAIAQAAPVPLQAMSLAGDVLGFVPFDGSGLIGAGVSAAAEAGSVAVAALRTKSLLKKMNEQLFGPRGLRVSICKSKEMVSKLGLRDNEDPTKLTLAPLDPSSLEGVNLRNRILQGLAPHTAPLIFSGLPPTAPQNIMDKLAAKQIQTQIKEREKKNNKKAEKFVAKLDKQKVNIEKQRSEVEEHRLKLERTYLADGAGPSASSSRSPVTSPALGSFDDTHTKLSPLRSNESQYSAGQGPVSTNERTAETAEAKKERKKEQKMEDKARKEAEKLEKEATKRREKEQKKQQKLEQESRVFSTKEEKMAAKEANKTAKKEQKTEQEAQKKAMKMEKEALRQIEKHERREQRLEQEVRKQTEQLEKEMLEEFEKHDKKAEKMEFIIIENLDALYL